MSIVLVGSSSGSITLQEPAVAGTTVLNLPATSGTVLTTGSTFASTGPAFSAYAATNQTVTNATATKVNFGTEEFDTNNNFASSRFTPTVAGYYQINSAINCSHTSMVDFVSWIYKNGGQYKRGFGFTGTGPSKFIGQACGLVYLNGTTDFVEIYIFSNGSGSATINASSQDTWFDGTLVKAA